jgi:hypothetical protein
MYHNAVTRMEASEAGIEVKPLLGLNPIVSFEAGKI